MAFSHGKDFDVNLAPAGDPTTVGDFSQYCNSCSFPREKETSETTKFGDAAKTRVSGLTDGSFSLEGFFDPAADAILAALLEYTDDDAQYEITPQVGGPVYDGVAICTSYEVTGSVGDVVTWSAEFEFNGATTRT